MTGSSGVLMSMKLLPREHKTQSWERRGGTRTGLGQRLLTASHVPVFVPWMTYSVPSASVQPQISCPHWAETCGG